MNNPIGPTDAHPGSSRKMDVLRARYLCRMPLFNPRDAREPPDRPTDRGLSWSPLSSDRAKDLWENYRRYREARDETSSF